jgi:exoribonuclease II
VALLLAEREEVQGLQNERRRIVGRLTEEMARLCEDIRTLRESRHTLKNELANAHKDRQMDVFEMCTGFAGIQARKAKRAHGERLAFLNNLKQRVAELRRETRADLAVVRFAWAGKRA